MRAFQRRTEGTCRTLQSVDDMQGRGGEDRIRTPGGIIRHRKTCAGDVEGGDERVLLIGSRPEQNNDRKQ
jgi:hypothetical protein